MSDPETGIGSWSEADVKRALTEGVRPSGVPLAPQMPVAFYRILTPRDLDAVAAYVKTAAPVRNQVSTRLQCTPSSFPTPRGRSPRRHATLANKHRHDRACVPGLEQFLDRAARPNRSRHGGRGRQHAPTRHNHRR
jgi:hypothetical protein